MKIEIIGTAIRNNINASDKEPVLKISRHNSPTSSAMQAIIYGNIFLGAGADKASPSIGAQGMLTTFSDMQKDLASPEENMIMHVNMSFIKANRKDGGSRPIFTIKHKSKTRYASEIKIADSAKVIYNGKQLSCGARVWVQANPDNVTLINEMSFAEAKALGMPCDVATN